MSERLPTETVQGDSIRVLATHACQERCNFCHNEGAKDYLHTPIGIEETVAFSKRARDEFGLTVVHLTGGEPTLHPQIVDLARALKRADFSVQMTTNGDLPPHLLDEIIEAGVSSINFSLHAITPEDFRTTQVPGGLNEKLEYYEFLMRRKKSNIEKARQSAKVKLNTVVINEEITGKVIDFAFEQNIPLRLMRNLNNIEESDRIIEKLLSEKELRPILKQEAGGDSGGSGTVYGSISGNVQNPDVKVKKFGAVYLSSICESCRLKDTPRCREKFYGIRINVNPETLENEVRLCIDRDDEVVVKPSEIFEGRHYEALKQNYGS